MGYLTDIKTQDSVYNEQNNVYDEESNIPTFKRHIKKKDRCYYSDIIGDYIHDAITNTKYPWKVGSFDERRFFKVLNSTGDIYNNGSSNTAFYETPHAYMNHKRVELDDTLINNWYVKVNKLYPGQYSYNATNN